MPGNLSINSQTSLNDLQNNSFAGNTTDAKKNNTKDALNKNIQIQDAYVKLNANPDVDANKEPKTGRAKNLVTFVKNGLVGDPNFNFFQFMQISKIPYYLGGPGLVATILAGKNLLDMRANKAAKFNAKGMALGCLMYYAMTAVAQKCIDVPVKLFRGIDLNKQFVVETENIAETEDGIGKTRNEYHKLFESSKFIRWNLLYNEDGTKTKDINSKYSTIGKKMGMPDDVSDSDSTVRPEIMKTIKEAKAWEYIASAFAVMLGVGLGNQQAMKNEFCTGLFDKLKMKTREVFGKVKNTSVDKNTSLKHKFRNVKSILTTKVFNPLEQSMVSLWKGNQGSRAAKYTGKIATLGFLASILVGNLSILATTNQKKINFEQAKEGDQ